MKNKTCGCDPKLFCRRCERAGRKTPRPKANRGKPAAKPVSPPAPIRLPCIYEGAILESCVSCATGSAKAELRHVRDCELHDRCTRGPSAIQSCATCKDYAAEAAPAPIPEPFDSLVGAFRSVPAPSIIRTHDRCVVTLAVGDAGQELHALTAPSQRAYAERIGADYRIITGRTQAESLPTYEKFRVADYARSYPGGITYLDADVFVMSDAPDIIAATPVDAMGMVDVLPRMPSVRDWSARLMESVCASQGVPVLTGANEVYWNSGVWVGRAAHAGYWTPPPQPIRDAHWCDEEIWCKRMAFALGLKVHSLDKRFNWTWCEDRSFSQWDESRPWMVHLAGMGDYPGVPADWKMSNATMRKTLLKVMDAMRN